MAKLVYWVAVRTDDSPCYSIIGKTKKEVVERVKDSFGEYEPVVKRELYYKDAFDLFDWATGEGGGRT
jgi:hypothetical protein